MTVSASTWPKSGFTARVSVVALVRCACASSPTDPPGNQPCETTLCAPGARCSTRPSTNGRQLEQARRRQPGQPLQAAEPGDQVGGVARVERPVVVLLPRVDEAADLEPPRSDRTRREPQRGQRDAELDAVAVAGVGDLGLPDAVPVLRVAGVVVVNPVGQRARRVDREVEGADAVIAAVDVDPDPVRGEIAVAPLQAFDDRRLRLRAVDAHVQVRVVVQDADEGRLGGREAFVGVVLGEGVGDGRRRARRRHPGRRPRAGASPCARPGCAGEGTARRRARPARTLERAWPGRRSSTRTPAIV